MTKADVLFEKCSVSNIDNIIAPFHSLILKIKVPMQICRKFFLSALLPNTRDLEK